MTTQERIKLAKEALDSGSYDKETIEYIFPELKESEDEKIRRAVKNALILKTSCNSLTHDGVALGDAIAWLEKQKPAEWSEEDEKILNCIITDYEGEIANLSDTPIDKQAESLYRQYISCLKSLRPQVQCGYNPYKAVVESIAEMCRHYDKASHSALRDFYDNVKVKCKDAKEYDAKYPQKQWKPSEEQMKALKLARSFVTDDFSDNTALSDVLKSLYNDLKQL